MAFLSKFGNILKQTTTKQLSAQVSLSSPSLFQAKRCMSSSKLFVGGMSYSMDEESLREAFNKYGEVVETRVILDRETGRSRGFGFVTFTSAEAASCAIQALDGRDLHGRVIKVNYANDRTSGGGYGGSAGGYGGGGYGGGGYGGNNGGYGGGSGGGYGGHATSGQAGGGGYGSSNDFGSSVNSYGESSSVSAGPLGEYNGNSGGYGSPNAYGSSNGGFAGDNHFEGNPVGNSSQFSGDNTQFGVSGQFGGADHMKMENGPEVFEDGTDVAKRA